MMEKFVSDGQKGGMAGREDQALLQEFYSSGDPKPKEGIQLQMIEISQQLEKAKKNTDTILNENK